MYFWAVIGCFSFVTLIINILCQLYSGQMINEQERYVLVGNFITTMLCICFVLNHIDKYNTLKKQLLIHSRTKSNIFKSSVNECEFEIVCNQIENRLFTANQTFFKDYENNLKEKSL